MLTPLIGLGSDAMLNSWLTQNSGLYARIFQDLEAMHDGHSVTTWSGGQGNRRLEKRRKPHHLAPLAFL